MENKEFNLAEYMTDGVERIVKEAVRATLTDPRESAFMARFTLSSREASRRRAKAEADGENIPPFLIASITSSCNLLPILSIEGRLEKTDERRGMGVYTRVKEAMERIQNNHLIFGTSVTATTANLQEVTGKEFIDELRDSGCKAVIYVEFVPVTEESKDLAPGDAEREYMQNRLAGIREEYPDMVFISFPGDEKSSGGCLAAGRGFFHINSHGGAEPCPFSPYSDINVKNTSLRQALRSPLFTALRENNILMEEHSGGCVLFERKESVEALLAESAGRAVSF